MNDWGFKSQTGSDQNNIQAWISKRLFLLVVCALLVIIGGYLCASYFGTSPEPEVAAVSSISGAAAQVDAAGAANVEKQEAPASTEKMSVSSRGDIFSGPLILRGIIRDSRSSMALIEAGDAEYVASPGMRIEDQWVVKEIKQDEVVLESEKEMLRLRFHGRSQLETLAGDEEGDRD